ncbi:MAG TPA: IclR family transcriptional regulator [Nocardioides sp.]|nr:IclR family transcriptional regulator [Nocardioides sp.]
MAGNTRERGASVAARVLAVLGAFDDGHRALTLTQIARRTGLPVATAHRLVAELVRGDALERRTSGEYVVGRMIWDLGLLAPARAGLREAASPFLHDLYGATLATVHLGVRDGNEVLYLARLSGHHSVPVVSTVGSRLPMHATGVGKVLLAFAPTEVQQHVLGNLTRVTPYTITQPGRLERELVEIRQSGFAQTSEEMSLGACSVAVPVVVAEEVVGSVGLVVPSLREDRDRLVSALTVAAKGIGRTAGP